MYRAMETRENSAPEDAGTGQERNGRIADVLNAAIHRVYQVLFRDNRYPWRTLLISLLVGLVCAGFYGQIHQAPQEIYALRIHGDDMDDYPFLYLTEDEVEALQQDSTNWVMEYQGPDEIMIHYSHEGIGEIETVRCQISIILFVTMAIYSCIAYVQVCHRRSTKRLDGLR